MKIKLPSKEDSPEIFNNFVKSYCFVLPIEVEVSKIRFLHSLEQVYGKRKGRHQLFIHALRQCDFKKIKRNIDNTFIIK